MNRATETACQNSVIRSLQVNVFHQTILQNVLIFTTFFFRLNARFQDRCTDDPGPLPDGRSGQDLYDDLYKL